MAPALGIGAAGRAPARMNPGDIPRFDEISGASARVRYGLVVADVALAVVLLGGALLFIRSYLYE